MPHRFYATGRRKEATARVWITDGTGEITINHRSIEQYFGREVLRMVVRQPFEVIDQVDKYNVTVNVHGGGHSGQAGAIRHGLSRALITASPELRGALKKVGFLTRDSRVVERKKYGQPGARKRFQYSKR